MWLKNHGNAVGFIFPSLYIVVLKFYHKMSPNTNTGWVRLGEVAVMFGILWSVWQWPLEESPHTFPGNGTCRDKQETRGQVTY